jgi:LysR family hydrogen peroxide-inducible transcriptional activator
LDRHRNFLAAANACFVSQPTLSAMVKKLEEELNITIVKRGVQPLEFTKAGEQLLMQAKRILVEQQLQAEKIIFLFHHDHILATCLYLQEQILVPQY